jgi:hypothetical protein
LLDFHKPHKEDRMFVGIDWASENHAVRVQDDAGRKMVAFTVDRSADGFNQLVARPARFGTPASYRWPSSVPTGGYWTACCRPDTQWCRCRPTPSKRGGRPRSSASTCGCVMTTLGAL